jgi:hypothetical protein
MVDGELLLKNNRQRRYFVTISDVIFVRIMLDVFQ